MPRYELCYILAAQVSDDQVPGVTEQIRQFVSDFGGTEITEEQLGKKKLAYPIKKTRNGFYVALTFTMDSRKINALEAKIRTQTATIIRHLVINVDEHLVRSEKDKIAQSKLTHRPGEEETAAATPAPTSTPTPTVAAKEVKEVAVEEPQAELVVEEPEAAAEISIEDLDKQIEAALSDEIIK